MLLLSQREANGCDIVFKFIVTYCIYIITASSMSDLFDLSRLTNYLVQIKGLAPYHMHMQQHL